MTPVTHVAGDTCRHRPGHPDRERLFPQWLPPLPVAHRPSAYVVRKASGVQFRRALVLMLMTLVLPGSAQLVAGRKETGRLALRIWFGLIAVVAVLFGLGMIFELVRLLADEQHRRARNRPDRADGDGGRMGLPVHRRLAPRRPPRPAAEAAPGDGRHQRAALLHRRRLTAVRLARGGGAEGLHERDVHRRRRDRRPRRALQRAAARRRLRLGPLGAAAGQPLGGEHRRRDRRDGALRPAAQHAQLPLRRGVDHGRAVPRRLRLRRAVRAQLADHVGRGPQGPVQGGGQPRRRGDQARRSRASPA